MGRLIDTDALTTALIDAYGLDPERLRDVVERIPAAECDDVISRQADIDPCDTCQYNSLDWHEEPCESCTVGGENNHWKPSASPTQTNTSNALEALDCISRAAVQI